MMPMLRSAARYAEAAPKQKAFGRWLQCRMLNDGDGSAAKAFERGFPDSVYTTLAHRISKAAVAAGTSSGWAAPLAPLQDMASEWLSIIRGQEILGRIAPFARRVPPNIRWPRQSSGVSATWVGEAAPAPVAKLGFDAEKATIERTKLAIISVFTKELAEGDEAAAGIIQSDLAAAVVEGTDRALLSTAAAVADTNPAGLLNDAVSFASSGSNAHEIEADLAALFSVVVNGSNMVAPFLIASPANLVHLAMLKNSNGARVYPDARVAGPAAIYGVPVLTSTSAGDEIIMLDAAEVAFFDEGIEIFTTQEGSIEMTDAPSGAASQVSPYQTNSIAVRMTRYVGWALRRSSAVAYIADAGWSGNSPSF